ncbi:MAG: hypothetical protein AAF108_04565 [Planctomycetota bacterium]
MPSPDQQLIDSRDLAKWLGLIALVFVGSWALAAVASPVDAVTTVSAAFRAQIESLLWAGAYLAGALGIGLLAGRPLGARLPVTLVWTLGLAIQLFLSHLLGWLGIVGDALGPAAGLVVAWLIPGVGVAALMAHAGKRGSAWRVGPPPLGLLAIVPGASLLLAAAVVPPGWLWASEFGGYDTLAYHLSLPKDWLADGRLTTLQTNVYSALPSSMEAAFYHLGAMMGGVGDPVALIMSGAWLTASKTLHALIALLAAATLAEAARAIAPEGRRLSATSAAVASGLLLATPWVVVTGSMAYNELCVVALAGGATLAAACSELSPERRSLLAGLLLAAAAAAKPTAVFLAGPTVAAVLLMRTPLKHWARAVYPGVLAGTIVLTPWLVRNALATGNPVFPYATELFGTGHWSAEQAARWAMGHRFDGSIIDRIAAAVLPQSDTGTTVERFRGLSNPQWGGFWPLSLAAFAALFAVKPFRAAGGPLAVGLGVGIVFWLLLTHVQSRFLIPLAVPAVAAVGLATAVDRHRIAVTFAAIVAAGHGLLSVGHWLDEREGEAALALAAGPPIFLQTEPADEPAVTAKAFVNRELDDPSTRVLLLGDAAGLYWLPRTTAVTTWDRHPVVGVIEAAPDDPGSWASALVGLGYTHLVVSPHELARLRASGWLDPALTEDRLEELLSLPGRSAFPDATLIELAP